MTHAGKKRKRYLLLSCSGEVTQEVRDRVLRFARVRTPGITEKSVIAVPKGVIIRTDSQNVQKLREEFVAFEAAGVRVASRSISGSISKLKRLAA